MTTTWTVKGATGFDRPGQRHYLVRRHGLQLTLGKPRHGWFARVEVVSVDVRSNILTVAEVI